MLVTALDGTFYTTYEKGGFLGLVPQKLKHKLLALDIFWLISSFSRVSICTLENGLISRNISSASNLFLIFGEQDQVMPLFFVCNTCFTIIS